MDETHHLPTIMDSKMDMTDEDMKMETLGGDFSVGLPDEMHQHPANEGPSCSHRNISVSSRPRLKSTKSFPPYNQCIGGIGEDSKCDNVPDSQLSTVHHASLRNELVQSTKRKEDFKKNARCGDMKAKWKMRRGRLGRSWEIDSSRWEREEKSGREREHDDKERDGGTNSEWNHYRVRNSSLEIEKKEDEEKMRCLLSAVEGENEGSEGSPKDEEAEEMLGIREGPAAQECPSPHPILSKILQSSTTSSCSSINFSSGESDDVFSEGEDAERKKRMLKKVSKAERLTVTFNVWHFINTVALCLCMQPYCSSMEQNVISPAVLVICMDFKENLEVTFEWSLHDWLLLPQLCESRDGKTVKRKIKEEIFSTRATPFIIRYWRVVSIFTIFKLCDENLFRTQISETPY